MKKAIKCVICQNIISQLPKPKGLCFLFEEFCEKDTRLPKLSKTNEETGEIVFEKTLDVCMSCGDKIRAKIDTPEKKKFYELLFSVIEQDTKNDIDKQDSINN